MMDQRQIALRKAAILVATLDAPTADALLSQMPDEQSALIRRAMVALGEVDALEQDDVIGAFFRAGEVAEPADSGVELSGNLAHQIAPLPRRSGTTAAVAESSGESPFRFLHQTADERLGSLLKGERAQTIALVVSHLPSDRAARVLAPLTPVMQVEVLRRLVELDHADPHTIREVEQSLQSRVRELIQEQHRRTAGLTAVAKILEAADRDTRQSLVGSLLKHDRYICNQLQLTPARLGFGDIATLDRQSLTAVMCAAPPELLVLALAGAEASVLDRCLGCLPADRVRAVRKSLKSLGPTRLTDMEQAQQELVQVARRLEEAGQINLNGLGTTPAAGPVAVLV